MGTITLEEVEQYTPEGYTYVDMRGKTAYEHGHIPGAVCWTEEEPVSRLPSGKTLILYCSAGEQSEAAAEELQKQGYEAYSLKNGYREWLLKHYGEEPGSEELSLEERERYDRQMLLPQVGTEGQKKLKKAKVLLVGAGGLGAPAALYLAGAGVGELGIMDADTVTISNLHRQIIHAADRVGMKKAESAEIAIAQLNGLVRVTTYPYFLTAENAEEILDGYDFVIDAADNFETKFLINDVCVLRKKPFCHAGVLQFQGQVMTYVPGAFPCFRCIFEEIPKAGAVPNCSRAGIIGAMAGLIGSIQALEAIKYILGAGELLTGKMMVIDGLTMKIRIVPFEKKNEACRVCGAKRQILSVKENAEEYRRETE